MLKSNPLLSLVVPLYNEEENVFILCEKVERALTNYKYELILIDDCSNDNTKENINKAYCLRDISTMKVLYTALREKDLIDEMDIVDIQELYGKN